MNSGTSWHYESPEITQYGEFQFKTEKEKSKPKVSRRKEINLICFNEIAKETKERINKTEKVGSFKNVLRKIGGLDREAQDKEAWGAAVQGVAKSQTQLSN